jgi:hypothetical protein
VYLEIVRPSKMLTNINHVFGYNLQKHLPTQKIGKPKKILGRKTLNI